MKPLLYILLLIAFFIGYEYGSKDLAPIFMIVGVVGLVITLWWMGRRRG